MSKRKERYTERARSNRKTAEEGSNAEGPALQSPAILIGLAGLAIAGAMALGFLWAGGGDDTQTAENPDTPAESAEAGLDEAGGDEAELVDEEADAEEAAVTDPEEAADTADKSKEEPAAPAQDFSSRANSYTEPEDQGLDPENTAYFASIETSKGNFELQLFPDVAPKHVNSFIFLAREGFYDGLTFHRVVPEFVIQGGDPTGTGSGGPGYLVEAEFQEDDPVPQRIGSLAMARGGDIDSAGSQFYVILADTPNAANLTGSYTNFGHVVSGMETVLAITMGDTMDSITIEEKPIANSIVTADDIRAGNLPDDIE